MTRICAFVLFGIVSWVLVPQTECGPKKHLFKVRVEDSHIGFSIQKWLVVKEEGRFKEFEGEILFDPASPTTMSVEFAVKTASIDSRNERRDGALRSEEFLFVNRYPLMTFRSVKASTQSTNEVLIEGDLTIRGVTKRMAIPVRIIGVNYAGREIGSVAGFESTFSVNREDFGVGLGWDVLGKDVTIHLLIGANSTTLASTR
jgi:polyisoprenoid-binding protein YceI